MKVVFVCSCLRSYSDGYLFQNHPNDVKIKDDFVGKAY
jgi:hypothetical protein